MARHILFLLVSVFVAARGHVIKRSDDTVPYAVEVQQLAASYNQLTAQFTALQNELTAVKSKIAADERRVAFLAQFSQILYVTTPTSGPFHFDHALFNDGGGYDASLGVFTAPYSGVYSFQVKLYQSGHEEATHPVFDVMLNGNTLDRFVFGAPSTEGSTPQTSHTTAFTVRIAHGDKLWVQTYQGRAHQLNGGFHSYFSGAMLYAD